MRSRPMEGVLVAWLLVLVPVAVPAPSAAEVPSTLTERVSVSSRGVQGNDHSGDGSISADGRYVTFTSMASNLAPTGPYDGAFNVFVRDRATGRTSVVNVSSTEKFVSGAFEPDISADGRYVTFESAASGLVPRDTNDAEDIFLRDTIRGTTRRISVSTLERQGSGQSFHPSISAHGRFVAFLSYSPELLPQRLQGQPGATEGQIYVRDRRRGSTRIVSLSTMGRLAESESVSPSISQSGRYVTFHSAASNLVPGDTNGVRDVFVRDLRTGSTERVSVRTDESESLSPSHTGTISADGRYVAFVLRVSSEDPETTDLPGVYVRDRQRGTTTLVSRTSTGVPLPNTGLPTISANGRYVVFLSGTSEESDEVLVRDRVALTTRLVSVSASGQPANGFNAPYDITPSGSHVVFESTASNLVPLDTNGRNDVFVRQLR